jgi:hypothetical protein
VSTVVLNIVVQLLLVKSYPGGQSEPWGSQKRVVMQLSSFVLPCGEREKVNQNRGNAPQSHGIATVCREGGRAGPKRILGGRALSLLSHEAPESETRIDGQLGKLIKQLRCGLADNSPISRRQHDIHAIAPDNLIGSACDLIYVFFFSSRG